MKYVEKHGAAKAGRRYNKGWSYIYYWKARFDGRIEPLACQSQAAQPSQPAHGGGYDAHPEHAPKAPHLVIVELGARLRSRTSTPP